MLILSENRNVGLRQFWCYLYGGGITRDHVKQNAAVWIKTTSDQTVQTTDL